MSDDFCYNQTDFETYFDKNMTEKPYRHHKFAQYNTDIVLLAHFFVKVSFGIHTKPLPHKKQVIPLFYNKEFVAVCRPHTPQIRLK